MEETIEMMAVEPVISRMADLAKDCDGSERWRRLATIALRDARAFLPPHEPDGAPEAWPGIVVEYRAMARSLDAGERGAWARKLEAFAAALLNEVTK